jgi:putative DNA primase/helicase
MDALCERPELREFEVNAVELAKQRRGELVAAALTVLRAWHMANECIALSPFGSFEEWSRRIRAPLIWLDEVDPCETVAEIRENDPRRAELVAVVMQWKEHLKPNTKHTVQEVVECALNAREFFTALQAVASSTGGTISNVRLGRWLKRVQGKMVGNLVLRSTGKQVVIPFGRWLRFEC